MFPLMVSLPVMFERILSISEEECVDTLDQGCPNILRRGPDFLL